MPSKFINDGKKRTPSSKWGPLGQALRLDDLPDGLDAQGTPDEKSKIGDIRETQRPGEQKDPPNCCEIRRTLSERLATATRLFAEAVGGIR